MQFKIVSREVLNMDDTTLVNVVYLLPIIMHPPAHQRNGDFVAIPWHGTEYMPPAAELRFQISMGEYPSNEKRPFATEPRAFEPKKAGQFKVVSVNDFPGEKTAKTPESFLHFFNRAIQSRRSWLTNRFMVLKTSINARVAIDRSVPVEWITEYNNLAKDLMVLEKDNGDVEKG